MRPNPSSKASNQYSVEILTAEDVWSQFGPNAGSIVPAGVPRSDGIRWQRVGASCLGLLCTVVLHGLLLGGLLFGTAGRPAMKFVPPNEGALASGEQSPYAPSVLFFLVQRSITLPDWSPDPMAIPFNETLEKHSRNALIASTAAMPMPELSGSDEGTDDASPTAEAMSDGAGRAMLFGRYMGQIKARIERAWTYPVSTWLVPFDCAVQISQDRRGNV